MKSYRNSLIFYNTVVLLISVFTIAKALKLSPGNIAMAYMVIGALVGLLSVITIFALIVPRKNLIVSLVKLYEDWFIFTFFCLYYIIRAFENQILWSFDTFLALTWIVITGIKYLQNTGIIKKEM